MTAPRNTGEALLLCLRQLGVSHFFANPGTEFVSVIQGFHRLPKEAVPEPVLAPHELLAVSMAHGAYLRTGRPQAVMTHANVGAANALIGLIGAARMNVPLILISGATAATENGLGARDKLIHWAQEEATPSYRGIVKWEAEVQDAAALPALLERAHAIALSEPRGPVALRIARDVLVSEAVPQQLPAAKPASAPAPSPEAMRALAARLAEAERPVLLTNRLGASPGNVAILKRAAEKHALGVLTPEDYYVSFPSDHPLHLGYSQGPLRDADFLITLDTDAPWFPLDKGPRDDAFVAHAGSDPLSAEYGLRGHRGDLFVTAGTGLFLEELAALLPAEASLLARRRTWVEGMRPKADCADSDLTAGTISREIGEILKGKRLLVNELGLQAKRLALREPGSYIRSTAASPLGSGLGYALGAALASPGLTAIAAVGDGVALLSPLPGALALAAERKLPLLVVVLDNGGYRSVASATNGFYPDLPPAMPLTVLPQGLRFDRLAEFAGGKGITARTLAELRQALQEGLAFTERERKPAVVHVHMAAGDPGAGCGRD